MVIYEGCMSEKVIVRSFANVTKCGRKVVEHSKREEVLEYRQREGTDGWSPERKSET